MNLTKTDFGTTQKGHAVSLYTLTNTHGLIAKISDYGGTVTELWVPDREGTLGDIVLGFDNIRDYEEKSPCFGCLIGRYGNRIAKGKFSLAGKEYTLPINDGENHLHGGREFDRAVWDAEPFHNDESVGVKLHFLSKDMQQGYPGNLDVTVTYTLNNANQLVIEYHATTDQTTVCNLTNHNYYNLAGQGNGTVYDHHLQINADQFTAVEDGLIPTGELLAVKESPMDFTQITAIGLRINSEDAQLKLGGGYDHNWILNKNKNEMAEAATVYEKASGRMMAISTTEPAIQFYSGNFLDGTLTGKGKKVYKKHYGFCLETQHYPDSPNQPRFPSTLLQPGETYETSTVHQFSVQ